MGPTFSDVLFIRDHGSQTLTTPPATGPTGNHFVFFLKKNIFEEIN